MNGYYLAAAPAWVIVLLIAGSRLHDLGRNEWSFRHHLRRVGLMGVGTISFVMLATPFTVDHWLYAPPSWRSLVIAWSWSFVWITTEGLPPLWPWITGAHRLMPEYRQAAMRERLVLEWRALRLSFRPRRRRPPMAGPMGTLP